MAAESSSSSPPLDQEQYDVFLSFRGEDTRLNFTSHLHTALRQKNILTFIDDEKIERGDEISSTLLKAIERSKISIVIFSKNYATSRWCLNELVKIMECKKTVIPVFYHIDPTHVRNQSGPYEDAFAKHEICNQSKVLQWRTTLREAGSIAGWTSSNRLESELVESIVEDVLQKLNYMINPQVPSGLVGIHKQIDRIESLLCNGSTNVRILGIWGMGGIGKTTLADALFKKLSPQFEGCCFLENVREELKNHGKIELRNKLLTQILGDQKLYINTPSICSTFVVDRLQRRKVLIVLDDVSKSQQIEDLIGHNDFFGPDSKIIVTTRDKDVLKNENGVLYYEVMQLNIEESLHLFSLKAFHQDHPKEGFRHISEVVVNYAKSLPLALKVLGSLLYSKSQREWESTLKKLKKFPNAEIHHVLSLSYEGLDPDEQNIFLDIACCLKGETKWHIQDLLDGCGFFAENGLSLENKSLISISEHHIVNMHDMIQVMGWQIVRGESIKEPCRRSRLWDPEEIYYLFKRKPGIDYSVESISLDISEIKDVEICSKVFARMPKLRLLKFYRGRDQMHTRSNLRISKDFAFLVEELRYLKWDSFPLKALPTSFGGEMLVELDLSYSLIKRLWDNEQDLNNLKSLFLNHCKHLIELPNLSNAKKLEEIMLIYCESLRHVPSSIFSLDHLLALNMRHCKELRCIRSDIHSKSLQWVDLYGCSKLVEFSVVLEKLEYLNLGGTEIEELPSLVGRGRNLFHLDIFCCERLNSLPKNFYQMGLDTSIWISNCHRLQKMPPIIETSPYIKILRLSYCSNITELPINLGLLSALNELDVTGTSIETLPASIKLLSKLRVLNVTGCHRLQCLPELPLFLQRLYAKDCSSLEIVSGSAAATLIQNCFSSQNWRFLLEQFHESEICDNMMNFFSEYFTFTNCIRLNENGRKVIMDEAKNRIKSTVCTSLMLLAYRDPYHPSHLLFKDSHFQITHCFHRGLQKCSEYLEWKSSVDSDWEGSEFAGFRQYDNKHKFWVEEQESPFISSFLKSWYNDVCVLVPGSSIPRWFRYKAKGNRITTRLHPSFHLLGVAFYLVFSPPLETCLANFSLEFHKRGARIDTQNILTIWHPTSNIVALFYSSRVSNKILEAVKESIANDKSANCNLEISFRFYWSETWGNDQPHENGIKECGVWPKYDSDLEDENKKKLKKKRKRSLVLWNWKCRWQALIMRKKKNYFFKHRTGTKLSSTSSSRVKARMPKSWNELEQLPPSKKSKRSQDTDELARGTSGIAAVGGFHHDN